MVSYFAQDKTSGLIMSGGLNACLQWAFNRIAKSPESVIAIIKARPAEDARVIADVDKTGGRWVFGGRYVPKREVSKLTKAAHGS
ncbi:hypothetical protein [Thiothrix fructosivorans]|uniref:Uncharacterized protein n=1 Tax=Thiothrix fructosivorans TaxID=111770 RepID=A0A8B0SGT0_9GAMM|nr:hypothetical protein [Thiothrix fructosivorans]MBO0611788.1 hypothetical protein [Thiothrix fructosivorans]QTX10556.1 hypothetical protein J1836_018625 [Thiothrix fructosivorans]